MSAIHDLIAQVSDPRLRERLAAEWASASKEKKFGLVFQTSKQNVAKHLKSIFAEAELHPASVVNPWLTTAAHGKNYRAAHYTLDDAAKALPKPGKRRT